MCLSVAEETCVNFIATVWFSRVYKFQFSYLWKTCSIIIWFPRIKLCAEMYLPIRFIETAHVSQYIINSFIYLSETLSLLGQFIYTNLAPSLVCSWKSYVSLTLPITVVAFNIKAINWKGCAPMRGVLSWSYLEAGKRNLSGRAREPVDSVRISRLLRQSYQLHWYGDGFIHLSETSRIIYEEKSKEITTGFGVYLRIVGNS